MPSKGLRGAARRVRIGVWERMLSGILGGD